MISTSTKECTIHLDDEVNARVNGLRPEDQKFLWDEFGIYVDGYRFMPAFQLKRWDGKQRYFSQTGKTYVKLLQEIVPYIISWGYKVNIEDHRTPVKVITDRINVEHFSDFGKTLRPYQANSINKLLIEGSGFLIGGTRIW